MAHGINRLTAASLGKKTPGLYHDGLGLYLQITRAKDGKGVNRSWLFRFTVGERDRWMGLGSVNTVRLVEAREMARQARLQRLQGVDPIVAREAERAAKIAASAATITFEAAALGYVAAHRSEWRSQEHAAQWPASLRKYVYPIIGTVPVEQIDTPLLLKVLQPIWATVPETASRIRGRVEAILDWATVSGYRSGDNPARWAGHLEYLLAKPSKRRIEHHAAMPWRELPSFTAKLRQHSGVVARCLEFTLLTAARRDEARCATWSEIDLATATWTIPASRMKAGKPHRVPLSDRVVAILREMEAIRQSDFVFPGEKGGATHKEGTRMLLKTLAADCTVHGFRSSFRDWCSEQTSYPREMFEIALAHAVGDKTEQAYARSDMFTKRARLMEAWAQFCNAPQMAGEVIPMRAAAD